MPPNTKKCCSRCIGILGKKAGRCIHLDCPCHTPSPVISIQIAGDEITTNNTCNCGMIGTHKISENCGVLQQSLRKYPTPEKCERCGIENPPETRWTSPLCETRDGNIRTRYETHILTPSPEKCECNCEEISKAGNNGAIAPTEIKNIICPIHHIRTKKEGNCASTEQHTQTMDKSVNLDKSEHDGTCRTPECYLARGNKVFDGNTGEQIREYAKPTPAVEDWEKEFDGFVPWVPSYLKPEDASRMDKELKSFIRSLRESDRKRIVEEITELQDELSEEDVVDRNVNRALSEVLTFITNLK